MQYLHNYFSYILTDDLKKDFLKIKRDLKKAGFKASQSKQKELFNPGYIITYYLIKDKIIIEFTHYTSDNSFNVNVHDYKNNKTFLDFNMYDLELFM